MIDTTTVSTSQSLTGSLIIPPVRDLKIIDPGSEPIILMGLPRSGSLALHEYFQCQGMTSRHYCCCSDVSKDGASTAANNKTSFPCPNQKTCGDCVLTNLKGTDTKAFDSCSGGGSDGNNNKPAVQVWSAFDVETDQGWFLPQHFALGLLHQQYPNAIWILNTRSKPKDWAMSIYHWHSMTRRFLHSFGHLTDDQGIWDDVEPASVPKPDRQGAHVTAEQVEQDLERSVARASTTKLQTKREEILAILEQIYQNHTETIVNWGLQFPTHRLVQIDVDEDPSAIQLKLDRAFGANYHQPSSSSSSSTQACEFKFEPPDNDWQDFSLPY